MTTLKNILSILVIIACAYLFITHGSDGRNYKKEKQELEAKIKGLESKSDSLNKISINLQDQYTKLQEKSTQDSIISDSLKNEYDALNDIAIQSDKEAKYYLGKFSDMGKKLKLMESNTNYKKGDDLLKSLSKKIN